MPWKSICESNTLEIYVTMTEYPGENDYVFEEIKPHVLVYFINFESNVKNRFPELNHHQHEWLRNPFIATIGEKMSHISIVAK
jgi:hypothetical protein